MLGFVLAAAFLFCYMDVLVGMGRQWWNISFYSYAFLIPGISAYLAWVRRDQLWAVQPRPAYVTGTIAIAAGLSALMLGRAGGVQTVQQISLLMTLPGVILFLFGWPVLKVLGVPIAFLGFMIPVWDAITEPLHFPFQRLSADLGVWLLNAVGIPVYQNGVFIYLPNITLEVAKSCSGVNYLIAVLATSISLSTIVLDSVLKRITLVVFAVTVSALANSLRVALIGVLAYYDVSGDLHGPYHTLHGMFTSMIGYLVIFVGLWVLSRGQNPAPHVDTQGPWKLEWPRVRIAWVVLAVLLVLVGASGYLDRSQPVVLVSNGNGVSLVDVGWIGTEVPASDMVPGADQKWSWTYRAGSGEDVRLSLWYFASQSQGKELIHAGTSALHSGATTIRLSLDGRNAIEVNRRILSEGGKRQVAMFWYDLNGRLLTGPLAVKLYTALDGMTHGRTNGALIWVATDLPSAGEEGVEQATTRLGAFVSQVFPRLTRFLSSSTHNVT
ncbi:MAG: exosortase W [Nitrospira sp.]|nr:exosortase W [Nitrospira sp.]